MVKTTLCRLIFKNILVSDKGITGFLVCIWLMVEVVHIPKQQSRGQRLILRKLRQLVSSIQCSRPLILEMENTDSCVSNQAFVGGTQTVRSSIRIPVAQKLYNPYPYAISLAHINLFSVPDIFILTYPFPYKNLCVLLC